MQQFEKPALYSWIVLLAVPLLCGCLKLSQLPEGFAYQGQERPTQDVMLLTDRTWVDDTGTRHSEQQIFDEVFRLIAGARNFILADMFLYNDFQGRKPELHRLLSQELTDRLVAKRAENPGIEIHLVTDPINTVYGGVPSHHLDQLRAAGVNVVETNLDALPDSNPCYSLPWRLFVKPFGNSRGSLMSNPFGDGRVSLRSWMRMLNFKANHRKVLIVDNGDTYTGLVTSANPHDGSSAHSNVAVRFSGEAAIDLLESEFPVFQAADAAVPSPDLSTLRLAAEQRSNESVSETVQVLTENRIKEATLRMINDAVAGDRVDLFMFYLSERQIINALKQAHERGVAVRLILDPNKDAFGWKKNGIPNRQVAAELTKAGVPVRWCDTHGEQCHTKSLTVVKADGTVQLLAGSANFTRRNLNNLNLETDALVTTHAGSQFAGTAIEHFESYWSNADGRHFTTRYEDYQDRSVIKRFVYRVQEATGMSTF